MNTGILGAFSLFHSNPWILDSLNPACISLESSDPGILGPF